jgi:tetratricopeptide (TPR) repeat protein
MRPIQKPDDIIFILGAGASIPCGVPGMKEMHDLFMDSLRDTPKYRDIVLSIKETDSRIDQLGIEFLLEKFHILSLISSESNPDMIRTLFNIEEQRSHLFPLFKELKDHITDFLFQCCSCFDEEEVKKFYGSFLRIREAVEDETIHIFSLNYDTCVECACRIENIDCSQGFNKDDNAEWNGVFDEEVNLYKLHGSVSWRGHNLEMIHMPVPTRGKAIKVGKKEYEMVVLYPMITKYRPYIYPFSNLIHIFEDKLNEAQVCAVIGYSLRDHHIKSILQKAMRDKEDLELWLINPHASQMKNQLFTELEEWPKDYEKRVYAIDASFEETPDILKERYKIRSELSKTFNELKKKSKNVDEIYQRLGLLWRLYGNYEEAIIYEEESLTNTQKDSPTYREALRELIHSYDAVGSSNEKEIATKLVKAFRLVRDENLTEFDMYSLGKAYVSIGDKSMAEHFFIKAIESCREKSKKKEFKKIYRDINRYLGRETIRRLIREKGPALALEAEDFEEYGRSRRREAGHYEYDGLEGEFRKIHLQDKQMYQKIPKEDRTAIIWENLGEALDALNQKKEALPCFKKARSLYREKKQYVNEKRVKKRIKRIEDQIRWET